MNADARPRTVLDLPGWKAAGRKLPINLEAQAFYNVVKPDDDPTADWTLLFQVEFLFPK